MYKYGLQGKIKAVPGKGDQLAKILLKAAELVGRLESCHLYMVSRDAEDKDCIWINEVWDSKEAHDQSLQLESVGKLIALAIPILEGKPEKGLELEYLGGYGF